MEIKKLVKLARAYNKTLVRFYLDKPGDKWYWSEQRDKFISRAREERNAAAGNISDIAHKRINSY